MRQYWSKIIFLYLTCIKRPSKAVTTRFCSADSAQKTWMIWVFLYQMEKSLMICTSTYNNNNNNVWLFLQTIEWYLRCYWRPVAGPTIAEDKELLSTTQNPILSELRRGKEKKFDISDKTALEKKLEELRRSYENLKKKRFVCRFSYSAVTESLFVELTSIITQYCCDHETLMNNDLPNCQCQNATRHMRKESSKAWAVKRQVVSKNLPNLLKITKF